MTGLGYEDGLFTDEAWMALADAWIEEENPGKRMLILPPDMTRCYSYAGVITSYLYRKLQGDHEVFVMPAVGTHMQMDKRERETFFPGIPDEAFLCHNWKEDNVCLGVVPGEYLREVTGGRYEDDIQVLLNKHVACGEFDTVVSVGQVVPHEVVGMANYTKNLVVGIGGRDMINKSHMVSAICNIETIMGNVDSPVRAVFDYAQKHYLDKLGITFFLTVTMEREGQADLCGLYIGKGRDTFEAAAALSQKKNINWLDSRSGKVVAFLDPAEFRSTWVGNKAIYRTRMAIADGGELVILAPGLKQFGENDEVDACIRKFGYCGTENVLKLYREKAFEGLEMVAAHLIHGSSDGRFKITYATDPELITPEEIRAVGFEWMDVREALRRYRPEEKETGYFEEEDGAKYYFIKAPAVGLWRVRQECRALVFSERKACF